GSFLGLMGLVELFSPRKILSSHTPSVFIEGFLIPLILLIPRSLARSTLQVADFPYFLPSTNVNPLTTRSRHCRHHHESLLGSRRAALSSTPLLPAGPD